MIRISFFATSLILLLAGCSPQLAVNRQITSYEGEPILVGKIDRTGLQSPPYDRWFAPEYDNYAVDREALAPVEGTLRDTEVLLFMGTWCEDSQMQVPQFYRILDAVNYDRRQLTVVSLDNHPDRYKTSPGQEEKGWDIHSVPTFIFLRNGKELGRIVEFPEKTLEKDIATILGAGRSKS